MADLLPAAAPLRFRKVLGVQGLFLGRIYSFGRVPPFGDPIPVEDSMLFGRMQAWASETNSGQSIYFNSVECGPNSTGLSLQAGSDLVERLRPFLESLPYSAYDCHHHGLFPVIQLKNIQFGLCRDARAGDGYLRGEVPSEKAVYENWLDGQYEKSRQTWPTVMLHLPAMN